jgi:hypothetical protein
MTKFLYIQQKNIKKRPRREWAAVATAKAVRSDDQQAHSKKDFEALSLTGKTMKSSILKCDLLFLRIRLTSVVYH